MQSTNGAMDSSWNSDPNPESCRNSSPRSRLWNLDPPNGAILARARMASKDPHKAYFDSAFAEMLEEKLSMRHFFTTTLATFAIVFLSTASLFNRETLYLQKHMRWAMENSPSAFLTLRRARALAPRQWFIGHNSLQQNGSPRPPRAAVVSSRLQTSGQSDSDSTIQE